MHMEVCGRAIGVGMLSEYPSYVGRGNSQVLMLPGQASPFVEHSNASDGARNPAKLLISREIVVSQLPGR